MAEMQISGTSGRGSGTGPVRSQKMSTRIDFTPMVDLGFLLITFFMLATNLAKPQIMALVMPKKPAEAVQMEPVPESKVLTLLLGGGDKIYWYEGITNPVLDSTDYSREGLRRVILDKMEKVEGKHGLEQYENPKNGQTLWGSYLTVLIKPTAASRYVNLVDALDEMAITRVRYYAILGVSDAEEAFIYHPEAGLVLTANEQARAASR